MPLKVNKRKGENFNSLLYRFNLKLKRSGLFKEVKKRRFFTRPVNKIKRRKSALYRETRREEMKNLKRYGYDARGRRLQ